MLRTYEFIIDGKSQGREVTWEDSFVMPKGFGSIYGDTPDKIEYKNNHTKIYLSRKGQHANA